MCATDADMLLDCALESGRGVWRMYMWLWKAARCEICSLEMV